MNYDFNSTDLIHDYLRGWIAQAAPKDLRQHLRVVERQMQHAQPAESIIQAEQIKSAILRRLKATA